MDNRRMMAVAVIPSSDADWPELLEFALTYAGYRRIARTPMDLRSIVEPVLEELDKSGKAPAWAGVDLLRATLFFLQRATHMNEDYGPATERRFRVLVEAIRESSSSDLLVADSDSA